MIKNKYRLLLILVFLSLESGAQKLDWDKELANWNVAVLSSKLQAKIQALAFDSVVSCFGNKKLIVLGEQSHDILDMMVIKNSITQRMARQEKLNLLLESTIYSFYYQDIKAIHQSGFNIGPFEINDFHFGGTAGDDLIDSLDKQKTLDSVAIYGIDFIARGVPQIRLLYKDLLKDAAQYENVAKMEADTAFLARLVEVEMIGHAAIADVRYNNSVKQNMDAAIRFYDQLLQIQPMTDNKYKKRMWQCFYQSERFLLAEEEIDMEKGSAFDLKTLTERCFVLRDKFLYENVKWYFDEILDTSRRTIIDIASIHATKSIDLGEKINKQMNEGYRSMTMLLKADPYFKNKLYSLSVIPTSGYHGIAVNVFYKLPSPPKKSMEYQVANSNRGVLFYDLYRQPATFVMHPFPNKIYLSRDWSEFYDSIIFVADTFPNFFSKPRHE